MLAGCSPRPSPKGSCARAAGSPRVVGASTMPRARARGSPRARAGLGARRARRALQPTAAPGECRRSPPASRRPEAWPPSRPAARRRATGGVARARRIRGRPDERDERVTATLACPHRATSSPATCSPISTLRSPQRGLLGVVLEQGAAIRAHDVHVGRAPRRAAPRRDRPAPPIERAALGAARRAGAQLGMAARDRHADAAAGADAPRPRPARARAPAPELQGLLEELQREHACNRAIMQIELVLPRPPHATARDRRRQRLRPPRLLDPDRPAGAFHALRVLDLQDLRA